MMFEFLNYWIRTVTSFFIIITTITDIVIRTAVTEDRKSAYSGSFIPCSSLLFILKNNSLTCEENYCNEEDFFENINNSFEIDSLQCDYKNKLCIQTMNICDDVPNCPDELDESDLACNLMNRLERFESMKNDNSSNRTNIKRFKRQNVYFKKTTPGNPTTGLRLSTVSSTNLKINSVSNSEMCRTPLESPNQEYSIGLCDLVPSTSICETKPGDYVEQNTIIFFRCKKNYYNINAYGEADFLKICLEGEWLPTAGQCIPKQTDSTCRAPSFSPFRQYYFDNCETNDTDSICRTRPGEHVAEYTKLRIKCDDGYRFPNDQAVIDTFCYEGDWKREIVECQPNNMNNKSDNNVRINKESCQLPLRIEDYKYTVIKCPKNPADCRVKPGGSVNEYTIVHFKCTDGYVSTAGLSEYYSFCLNGSWTIPFAKCITQT